MNSTSKEKIYRDIRRSIIIGHRVPGERLDIDTITAQYETSVTPVRDALQMLSNEGLVMIKPRSGYYVASITLKELRDMLELRKILELAAIKRAAHRINQTQIQGLRSVHAGYTGDDDISYDRYTDENRLFHYTLAEISGNQALADTLGHLLDRLARFMVIRHGGKSQEGTHNRIVSALEIGDVDAARTALLTDIDASSEAIMDAILDDEASNWELGAL